MEQNEKHIIDLRSDTVTKPTDAMRNAMYQAEVGDDVYGEDPTVNKLESMVAQMLDKEAAILVSSGTMGNLVSVLSHCGRGDEIILGDSAHIFTSEQGGTAALGGVHTRTLRNRDDGTIDLDQVRDAIRGSNEHHPTTRLICIENTHNRCGGRALTPEYTDAAGELAHEHGLFLHVDGARLWNAAVALDVAPDRLVAAADSVTVCLSKGLGAPVGSVIAGSKPFIAKARRNRKVLGGGMRQAGILAAAGVVAVSEMVERLADDHANARRLADAFSQMDGLEVDPEAIETNLLYFTLSRTDIEPGEFAGALKARDILLNPVGGRQLRAVLNHHVRAQDIDQIVDAVADVLRTGAAAPTDGVYVYR